MPTATETARGEFDAWARIASHWDRSVVPELWADRPPTEKDVIVFHDPHEDLIRGAAEWGHHLPSTDLPALARFAAGLASVEAEGWEDDKPELATRAYEARRFLLADRILHWAVPWLDSVARWYPDHREAAHADRETLLTMADEARVAPALPGTEGLLIANEDSYGPVRPQADRDEWIRSLWSGALVLDATGGPTIQLTALYEEAAARWGDLATQHPGSAQLWCDLSRRAEATSTLL